MEKHIEAEARRVRVNTSIQHVLLRTIATAGLLSVALLAPNALQVLKMFDKGKSRRMNPKYLFGSAFEKLLMKGMVTIENTAHGKFVRLTEKGKFALESKISRAPTNKPRRWDKRWRVVIYDIREQRKSLRLKLKDVLRAYGFYRLQDSVWVYPYDCEDLLILLKANYKIGNEVLYLVVERVENDKRLKDHFAL